MILLRIYRLFCMDRMWRKVNFKSNLTGLNSDYSFLETGWLTQAKGPNLPYYLIHNWRKNYWIHTFPQCISVIRNPISLPRDLNSCRRVHFLWRSLLYRGHLQVYVCTSEYEQVWTQIYVCCVCVCKYMSGHVCTQIHEFTFVYVNTSIY